MSGRQNNSFLLSKLPIGDGCQLLCKAAAGRTHKMTKIPASHRHSQHFHQRYFKHPSPEPPGAPRAGKGCPRRAAAGGGEHCRSPPGTLGALQPHKPSRTPSALGGTETPLLEGIWLPGSRQRMAGAWASRSSCHVRAGQRRALITQTLLGGAPNIYARYRPPEWERNTL